MEIISFLITWGKLKESTLSQKKKLKCQQVYSYKISQIIKLVKKSCIALHMAETPLLKLPGTCIILIFQKYVFY